MKKIYILIAPPGGGKGTQAKLLGDRFKLPIFSPGEILRQEIKKGTRIGTRVNEFVKKGLLVPDDIVSRIIFERINKSTRGAILDGYPRNLNQVEILDLFLEASKTKNFILEIALSPTEIYKRILGRLTCSRCGNTYHIIFSPPKDKNKCDNCRGKLIQRSDAKKSVIDARLEIYRYETEPILKYYKKNDKYKCIRVDGRKSIKDIFQDIIKQI